MEHKKNNIYIIQKLMSYNNERLKGKYKKRKRQNTNKPKQKTKKQKNKTKRRHHKQRTKLKYTSITIITQKLWKRNIKYIK